MCGDNLTIRLPVLVVAVSDGDTVQATTRRKGDPFKIRLHGIDAPELDQEYGKESKEALEKMVLDKVVTVDIVGVDRYRRQVGILHKGKPRHSFNKLMVELGFAYNFRTYGMLWGGHNAQRRARSKRIGIWQRFGGEVRPWSHRHGGTMTPIEYEQGQETKRATRRAEVKQAAEALGYKPSDLRRRPRRRRS